MCERGRGPSERRERRPGVPLLRRAAPAHGRRPGDVSAVSELPPADRIRRWSRSTRSHVFACERCFLVQLEVFVQPEDIFTDYAYYSAYSTSWVDHARELRRDDPRAARARPGRLRRRARVERRLPAAALRRHGVPILGIDPAANVAEDAEARGVPTLVAFFGRETARALWSTKEGAQAS